MGRSYSFHPEHAQQPAKGVQGTALLAGTNDDTEALTQQQASDLSAAPQGTRGKSETVRRYQQRAAARLAAEKKAAAKKATAKRATAKKTAPKKTAAKKTAAKTAVAKKGPAKKAAKAPAKKKAANRK